MARLAASQVPARAEVLVQRGAVAEAYALLEQATAAGDSEAAATLADWRLSGALIRRDLAAARDLYGQAAALGHRDAASRHVALLANGAGGHGRDWPQALELLAAERDPLARRQLRLLEAMDLDAEGNPASLPDPTVLNPEPLVQRIPGFLSAEECRYVIDRAMPVLEPAVVIHPQTGQPIRDPIRKALAAAFPFVIEDPALHAINRRIAAATGTSYEQGEPVQVLCYNPGDEYKPHSDALPPGSNQRVATLLVALNADYEGGETSFPQLAINWRGAVGEALHFRNVDAAGAPSAAMWHAGTPVRRGRKFLLSKWLRAAPLDLSGPPGRPF